MRNPLWRRIPKELKEELGKYIVIFLFMVITTGMVSGFMVAGESMKKTYDNTFDKYNVEDGHFDLSDEASDNMKDNIEDEGVKLYDMSYYELPMSNIGSDSDGNSGNVEGNAETKDDTVNSVNDAADDGGRTLRIFAPRHDVNKMCLMDGEFPVGTDEIAIDRMYAVNNDIEIGDDIKAGDKVYSVCGFVALSDYSTMFQNNNDTMFDATIFGIAVVSNEEFDDLPEKNKTWSYSWMYDDGMPDEENDEKKLADDLLETVYTQAVMNGIIRHGNQFLQLSGKFRHASILRINQRFRSMRHP